MNPKIKTFAKSIVPLLKWLSENPNDKDIKYVVSRIVRFSSRNPKDLGIPYMYSIGALNEAKNRGIDNLPEKLKWVRWNQQTHKSGLNDTSRKNGVFHLEHIVPVSQVCLKLYSLNEITVKSIHDILIDNLKLAWILKTEQKKLDSINRSGIRTEDELTKLKIFIKGFNY